MNRDASTGACLYAPGDPLLSRTPPTELGAPIRWRKYAHYVGGVVPSGVTVRVLLVREGEPSRDFRPVSDELGGIELMRPSDVERALTEVSA